MNALAFPVMRAGHGMLPEAGRADTIETGRLVLRHPAEADIAAMTALADNRRVAATLPDMPHPYTIADAGRFIRRLRDRDCGVTAFAITERDTGRLIGCCRIAPGDIDGESRIGFWIGEPHWNRGYMTEAAQALIDHAFTRSPRLTALRAGAQFTNPAARRVLEKCGFQHAGPGTETDIRLGCLVPVEHYRIDRGIWSAIKTWARGSGAQRLAG